MWAQSPVGPSDGVTQSCFLSQNPKSPKVSLFQPQEACPNINRLIPIYVLAFQFFAAGKCPSFSELPG